MFPNERSCTISENLFMRCTILALFASTAISTAAISDPVVAAKALGGAGKVTITSMSLDRKGNVVVGGYTTVADVNAPSGGASSAGLGKTDGFVACMSPDLATVLAFTYVGGSENDRVNGITIAPNGEIWVTGTTSSTNLPTTPSKGGAGTGTDDGFVLKFSSTLDKVLGGRYLAGAAADEGLAIACRNDNVAVICGRTKSDKGLPNTGGHDQTHNGGWDGFVAVIATNGADVESFSYYGSTGDESFTTVAIDNEGGAVVAGTTTSNDLETIPKKTLVWVEDGGRDPYYGGGGEWREVGDDAFDKEYNGGPNDALLCRFMGDGTLKIATYVGGSGEESPASVMVDADNHPVIVGTTTSANFPMPAGSSVPFGGKQDIFLISINREGLAQRYGRFVGGEEADIATSAVMMANGNVMMTGTTTSTDLSNVGVGSTRVSEGGLDGFVANVNSQDVKFMTLVGWRADDTPTCIALDADGNVLLAGTTLSDLPDGKRIGPAQSFVAKRVFGLLEYRTPTAGGAVCTGTTQNVTWTTNDVAATATYAVETSGDDGATWTAVASALKSKSYQWKVPTPPTSGKLWLRIRSSQGHTSGPAVPFSVEGVPVFTQQPSSGNYCIGATVTLEPAVEGSTNMTYQWRKDGADITGATSRALTIESADASTTGSYTVVASTSCSSVTSSPAVVSVFGAPSITTQPQSATVQTGGTIRLSIAAEGGDLTYQWEKNDTPIEGATSATFTIPSATAADAGTYRCAVTSACGTVKSASATVNVGTTSVTEVSSQIGINPHPLVNMVNITLEEALSADALISLTDVTGTLVMQSTMHAGMASASVPVQVTPGLYTLTIQGPSMVHRRTVVVH